MLIYKYSQQKQLAILFLYLQFFKINSLEKYQSLYLSQPINPQRFLQLRIYQKLFIIAIVQRFVIAHSNRYQTILQEEQNKGTFGFQRKKFTIKTLRSNFRNKICLILESISTLNNQTKEKNLYAKFILEIKKLSFINYYVQLKNPKRILVIGNSQEGKSLFSSAFGNSLLIGYLDNYRYHICNYDQNKELVQECNIMEDQIQYQFLEVPANSKDQEKNQIIMRNTYQFLREKNIGIDIILICRRYSCCGLTNYERNLIFNLAEIFSKAFIKKCMIINTQHDCCSSPRNYELEKSLNGINRIYDLMPEPKQLYVNSNIAQADQEQDDLEGFNQGLKRFESIERVRDSLLQIFEQKQHVPIFAIEKEVFDIRREEESRLQHYLQQLRQSLIELKPTLQNYFTIFEKNENDEAFFEESVTWQELDYSKTIELKELLDKIILNDSQQKDIEKRGNERIGLLNIQRLNNFIKQESYKLKMIILKDRCEREKYQSCDDIKNVANRYIEAQSNFSQDTFWETQCTVSQLIQRNCPLILKRYLAEELYPEYDQLETYELYMLKQQLRQEFHQIKISLGLEVEMNDVYQTQLLQGVL